MSAIDLFRGRHRSRLEHHTVISATDGNHGRALVLARSLGCRCVIVLHAHVGASRVDGNVKPMMISEDFGAFLRVVPGNFVFIGNGAAGDDGGIPLHNATYDFNDRILETGARYFAELTRLALPRV